MIVMLCTDNPGGMRSVVMGYERDGLFSEFDVRLIVTHRSGSVLARLVQMAAALCTLGRLLFSGQVRVVHAHAAMRGSFWRKNLLLMFARCFGVKTVLHLHGSELKEFVASLSTPARAFARRMLRSADSVLVLSQSWADFIRALEPAAVVDVMPNYVVVPDLAEQREQRRSAEVRCLFLGLLGQRKGIYELLEAFVKVRAQLPGMVLVVGGNGEVDQVRARVSALGLGGAVTVLGWVGPEAKARQLSEADVYVLPSHNEGLPVSILEAMSYGLPVVSTRVGGIPELVREGIDGLLVDAGDVDAIEAALLQLGQSAELRQAYGSQARERIVESYSREVVLPQLSALYRRLAA